MELKSAGTGLDKPLWLPIHPVSWPPWWKPLPGTD